MKNYKSGHIVNQGYYKSFQPTFLNRTWQIDDLEILSLLSKADRAIGKLDMYSQYIPNIELFISMHVLKEATQSTKIEGTETNMEEALLDKSEIPLDKRDDWDEVQNYIKSMNEAIKMLDTLPFSSRFIREAHKTLLQGVRGEHKLPGEFRQSQNWIGGVSINDATFIPPIHTTVPELMSDLEKFIHNEEILLPDLLKIAIIHYQFETIHPFLDGNGRIGRLMIPLYLIEKQIIKSPVFYLSDFFERNRALYYDNLMGVRKKNDLKQWLKFFLVGTIQTAENGIRTFDAILQLQKNTEAKIRTLGAKAGNAITILNYLYQRPLIDAQKVMEITKVSTATAYKLLEHLEQLGILKEFTGNQRGKSYWFSEYLDLFKTT
jgi:Fic family protein